MLPNWALPTDRTGQRHPEADIAARNGSIGTLLRHTGRRETSGFFDLCGAPLNNAATTVSLVSLSASHRCLVADADTVIALIICAYSDIRLVAIMGLFKGTANPL